VRLERHRPQEPTDRGPTGLPPVPRPQKVLQRTDRPTSQQQPEALRRLDHQRGELLPDLGLDNRGTTSTRPVAEPVVAVAQKALQPAPDHLMVFRQ
jgi:hypothetical protein